MFDSQTGDITTKTDYGANPEYGLVKSVTEDSGGLNLATRFNYESPGTNYFRQTYRILPGGNYTYFFHYDATEKVANPCVPGSQAVSQAGFVSYKHDPDPGGLVVNDFEQGRQQQMIYDAAGRILATHYNGGSWTCTTYDARGRIAKTLVPTVNGRTGRTIVNNYAVGGNPLITSTSDSSGTVTDLLLGVFHSLYESAWGPRTSDILHACLLSLARRSERLGADAGVNLVMVPLLLTNPAFRSSVIGSVVKADPLGLGSFWATFEAWSEAERSQAIQPLMNKLRQLLLRPGLRGVFGQRQALLALSQVFARRRILLVNLSEGLLGPEAAQLLGSLVVGLLWQAALGRTQLPERLRTPVFVHVDEMQRYVRLGDVGDALARARGLGVGFTLAHQHLGQLSKSLRDAVMANARSKVAFQLPLADSTSYAALTAGLLEAQDFQALPAFHTYAQLLVGNQPSPWCSLVTEPLSPAAGSGFATRVQAMSRARYGRPLDEIEQELARLAAGVLDGRTTTGAASERLGRHRPHTPSKGAE